MWCSNRAELQDSVFRKPAAYRASLAPSVRHKKQKLVVGSWQLEVWRWENSQLSTVSSQLITHHSGPSRKEVFQPHLPVRLPCYDLAPVTEFALGGG